jgi:hypothetical protein
MALSARDLLDRSELKKLPFEDIWETHSLGYHVRGPLFAIARVE